MPIITGLSLTALAAVRQLYKKYIIWRLTDIHEVSCAVHYKKKWTNAKEWPATVTFKCDIPKYNYILPCVPTQRVNDEYFIEFFSSVITISNNARLIYLGPLKEGQEKFLNARMQDIDATIIIASLVIILYGLYQNSCVY